MTSPFAAAGVFILATLAVWFIGVFLPYYLHFRSNVAVTIGILLFHIFVSVALIAGAYLWRTTCER